MDDKNSIYYGLNNNISANIIKKYNPPKTKENALILGQSGGGMQFSNKIEQINKDLSKWQKGAL